jgi:hypothetical protein
VQHKRVRVPTELRNDERHLPPSFNLGLDFFGGEIGSNAILRVGRFEFGLISVDQAINDRPPKKLASF